MTSKITEQDVEDASLEILGELGYEIIHGINIAPDSETPLRSKWDDVILKPRLKEAIQKLNPKLPDDAIDESIKKLKRLSTINLIKSNEKFHNYLIEGIPLEYRAKNGKITSDNVKLIDYQDPNNNRFSAINQFTIIENNKNRRPDIIIFINGLPISVIELKNSASESANLESAYKQLQTYKDQITSLFLYNELLVISDGTYAQVGTLTSNNEWFLPWKTID